LLTHNGSLVFDANYSPTPTEVQQFLEDKLIKQEQGETDYAKIKEEHEQQKKELATLNQEKQSLNTQSQQLLNHLRQETLKSIPAYQNKLKLSKPELDQAYGADYLTIFSEAD